MVLEAGDEAGTRGDTRPDHHKGHDPLALDRIGQTYHRTLGHRRMADERALHIGGADAVTRHVQHIVRASQHSEVAIRILHGHVPHRVEAGDLLPVFLVALVVVPHGPQHVGQRELDDQQAALAVGHRTAVVVHHGHLGAGHRLAGLARAGFEGRHGPDHRTRDLRLPPVVHHLPVALPDEMLLGPAVGLGVQRFPGAGHQPQLGEVILARRLGTVAHPHAHGGGGSEHDVDTEPLADLPGDLGARVVRRALAAEHRGADAERAVDDEAVAHHPANVGGAPVDVALLDLVEGLAQIVHAHQVAAGGMDHALGLARGATGVEDEQRVLGIHHLGIAVDLAPPLDVVEVLLALAGEADRVVTGAGAAAVDDHVVHRGQVAHGLVHDGLEGDGLPAAVGEVGTDHDLGAGVLDAGAQGQGAHACVDHAVDGADAGTGQHRDDALRGEGHVEDHAIALLHAQALEGVGEAVHLAVEAVVGVGALVAILAHPQQGSLVAAIAVHVAVDAVDRGVQLPADEPGVVGGVELEDLRPGLGPVQGPGLLGPEGGRIFLSQGALHFVVDGRLLGQPAPHGNGRLAFLQRIDGGFLGKADFHVAHEGLRKGGGMDKWGC